MNSIIYQYECAACGLQSELGLDEFNPDNPVVTCPMCDAIWIVEVGDSYWLEPVQEMH